MNHVESCRWTCGALATDVAEFARFKQWLHTRAYKDPTAHIPWLFLCPNDLLRIWITLDDRAQSIRWEGIEFFETYKGNAAFIELRATLEQIVIELPAAGD